MEVALAALLLIVALPAQEDEAGRNRLDDLIRRLGADDLQVRDAASRDLLLLPLRFHAELLRRGRSTTDAEVRDRIGRATLPPEWVPFLRGTIKEALEQRAALRPESGGYGRWRVERALRNLEDLPVGEQGERLEALLALPDPAARVLALEGMVRVPPKDFSRIVPFMSDPATQQAGARILIQAGDRSVTGALAPLLLAKRVEGEFYPSAAIRVLSALGPAREEMLVGLVGSGLPAAKDAAGILAATPGPEAEEALCGLYRDKSLDPNLRNAVEWALGIRGGPKAAAALVAGIESIEPETLEFLVHQVRDPGLIQTWFRRIRRQGRCKHPHPDTFARTDLELACLGGPVLREDVLEWLRDPKLDPETRKKLILLLGAVGGKGDAPLLRGLLREPGLEDDAAEALGRIGDPADARPLMDAFRVYTNGLDFGIALLSLPVEGLEADLEEIFAKPSRHPLQDYIALNMARRSRLPRLRAALFKGLLDGDEWWGPMRIGAIQILRETWEKADEEAIGKLRASAKVPLRISGLFLAQAGGDVAALEELIPLLSGHGMFESDASVLLDGIAPGEAARAAVEAAWKKRPAWKAGRYWLVRHGDAEALRLTKEEVRNGRTDRDLSLPLRSLVAARDPEGMLRMLDGLDETSRQFLADEEVRLLAGFGDDKTKERLMLRARGRPERSDDPFLRALGIASLPEAIPLYRSAVRDFMADGGRNRFVPECARALGRLRALDSVADLRSLLRSPNGAHRAAAIEALAMLGDRASIPDLAVLLEDPTAIEQDRDGHSPWIPARRRVWQAAIEALESLTGVRSEGKSTSEVRAFWREQVRRMSAGK
jgi:HEAT repeat protein